MACGDAGGAGNHLTVQVFAKNSRGSIGNVSGTILVSASQENLALDAQLENLVASFERSQLMNVDKRIYQL